MGTIVTVIVLFVLTVAFFIIKVGTNYHHFKMEYHAGYYIVYRKFGLFGEWIHMDTFIEQREAEEYIFSTERFYNADLYEHEHED
jgi:hypothetical protein